jgi:hypothetical protein
MSRTYKDKSIKYRSDREASELVREEAALKKRFANHRRSGPPLDVDLCPECGGFTEYESGFTTCTECGWVDSVEEMNLLERRSA